MRNRDMPATSSGEEDLLEPGLTKRDVAAIAAMQANRIARPDWHEGAVASQAIDDADALFDELEKSDA